MEQEDKICTLVCIVCIYEFMGVGVCLSHGIMVRFKIKLSHQLYC